MKIISKNLVYNNVKGHEIVARLKKPLSNMVTHLTVGLKPKPWESACHYITKVALSIFKALFLVVPFSMAWLLGKVINQFTYKINMNNLSKAPPPIQIPEDLEIEGEIDINKLVERYFLLNIPVKDGETPGEEKLAKLCNFKNQIHSELSKKQLDLFLKGIVAKLESGKISPDLERAVLLELAEAATRCPPTWIEVAGKLYAKLEGREETGEVKLLRLVQDYKEEMIVDFLQIEAKHNHWHALNYVRNILGHELGLNTELNKHDPHGQGNASVFQKSLTKWIFLEKYGNVNKLTNGVTAAINSQDYDPAYHDILVKIVKNAKVEAPEDYVAEHFYTEDYKIKPSAVHLMLRAIEILN